MKVNIKGDFKNTEAFLKKYSHANIEKILAAYGERGVRALEEATPKRTGLTSRSWVYEIKSTNDKTQLIWRNTNIQNGTPVAVVIQYGFVMPSGYRVEGRDYINPALKPILEELEEIIMKGRE